MFYMSFSECQYCRHRQYYSYPPRYCQNIVPHLEQPQQENSSISSDHQTQKHIHTKHEKEVHYILQCLVYCTLSHEKNHRIGASRNAANIHRANTYKNLSRNSSIIFVPLRITLLVQKIQLLRPKVLIGIVLYLKTYSQEPL